MNISNFINGPGIGGESVLNTPKRPSEERGGFWSALAAASAEKPGDSEILFQSNDYTVIWKSLTDEDFASLAQKYDSGNMSAEQFRDFLNDLESMGAISAGDHEKMTAYCMTVVPADTPEGGYSFGLVGYASLDGCGGDLRKLLSRLAETIPQEQDRLELLSGIVDRMDAVKDTVGSSRSLMEEAADPSGEFWLNLRQTIVENAKKNEELRKEQEAIEMMAMMLDSMTGRIETQVSAASGLRLGMNADYDVIKSGHLSELHAYMLVAGNQPDDVTPEEPEDKADKVEAAGEASAGKLYANSEKRQDLTAGDLDSLAKRYDPNNMSREQYSQFLDDMVALGVASKDVAGRIGYQSAAEEYGGEAAEASIMYAAGVPDAPVFQPGPIDSDIEGWIKNRMLWKPGITREAARRAGLANEYEQIIEEEKTLSRIAEILADVKRQRYPSVEL